MFFDYVGFIGGILLIIGAFLMYKGFAKWSILTYFFADVCWVILAAKNESIFSAITIIIGMFLGLGVYLKMHFGIFVDKLHKNNKK